MTGKKLARFIFVLFAFFLFVGDISNTYAATVTVTVTPTATVTTSPMPTIIMTSLTPIIPTQPGAPPAPDILSTDENLVPVILIMIVVLFFIRYLF